MNLELATKGWEDRRSVKKPSYLATIALSCLGPGFCFNEKISRASPTRIMQHNIIKLIALTATISFCNFPAFAQFAQFAQKESLEIKQKRQCIDLVNQQTAAFVAEDWEQLNRIAMKFINSCKEVYTARDLASGYSSQATALNRLGRPREALIAADSCIGIYYPDPTCHLERVYALIGLKRFSQVRGALGVTERLAKHNLETAENNLNSPTVDDLEKELFRSEINLFKSILNKIEALKKEAYGTP